MMGGRRSLRTPTFAFQGVCELLIEAPAHPCVGHVFADLPAPLLIGEVAAGAQK
jgi:hypothetical protein